VARTKVEGLKQELTHGAYVLARQCDEAREAERQLAIAKNKLCEIKRLAENPDSFWMPECVGCTSATDKACLLCACAYISGLCEERNMYG